MASLLPPVLVVRAGDARVSIPDVAKDGGGPTEPNPDDGGINVLTHSVTTGGVHGGRGGQPPLKPPGCEETHTNIKISEKKAPSPPGHPEPPCGKSEISHRVLPLCFLYNPYPHKKKERQKLTDKRRVSRADLERRALRAVWSGVFHAPTGAACFARRLERRASRADWSGVLCAPPFQEDNTAKEHWAPK